MQGGSCEDEVQLDEATCTDWISTLSRARRGSFMGVYWQVEFDTRMR